MGMFDKKPATAVAKKAAAPSAAVAKKGFGKSAAAPAKSAFKAASSKSAATSRKARDEDEGDDGDGVAVSTGWGGAKKMAAEHSGFAQRLELKDGEVSVGKFANDEPYANVATHWLQRKGRRSFICLGANCPLCAVGDNPRVSYHFNWIALTEDAPIVWSLEKGIKVFRKIEKLAQNAKYGPLGKSWYELERSGSGKDDTDYTFKVFKKGIADIEDEYPSLHIPSAREIEKLKLYSKDDVTKQKPSLREMKELAAEVDGSEYDPDDDDD